MPDGTRTTHRHELRARSFALAFITTSAATPLFASSVSLEVAQLDQELDSTITPLLVDAQSSSPNAKTKDGARQTTWPEAEKAASNAALALQMCLTAARVEVARAGRQWPREYQVDICPRLDATLSKAVSLYAVSSKDDPISLLTSVRAEANRRLETVQSCGWTQSISMYANSKSGTGIPIWHELSEGMTPLEVCSALKHDGLKPTIVFASSPEFSISSSPISVGEYSARPYYKFLNGHLASVELSFSNPPRVNFDLLVSSLRPGSNQLGAATDERGRTIFGKVYQRRQVSLMRDKVRIDVADYGEIDGLDFTTVQYWTPQAREQLIALESRQAAAKQADIRREEERKRRQMSDALK